MESIRAKIEQCRNHITMMREDLAVNEKYLINLYKSLQDDEVASTNTLLYNEETGEQETSSREVLNHPIGTKLKWVLNDETYRVAIITKNGVLQVKSVTDGSGECHEDGCNCVPCWETNHNAPWRPTRPLKKTLFATETDWRNSLPDLENGSISIQPPSITIKELSDKPLRAFTDPNKLKELHERFPGGVFILSTDKGQMELEYFYNTILARKEKLSGISFREFGSSEKPNLMVEWRGVYINLSHLL